jgi:hypothetical protein
MYEHEQREEYEEEKDWRKEFQQKLAAAIAPAIEALVRCARGEPLESDHQLRACMALTRLAPMIMTEFERIKPRFNPNLAHPDVPEEEVLRLLDIMEGKVPAEQAIQ